MDAANRPRGKVVEFIGIAGAGKSTICCLARDEFLRAGVEAVDAAQLLERMRNAGLAAWLVAHLGSPSKAEKRLRKRFKRISAGALQRFYQCHPGTEELVQTRLANMRDISRDEARRVEPWVAGKLADFELMDALRDDWSLCFWEEGIAQRSVNLFALVAEAGEPDGVERFLVDWPLPDALVHVRASLDTALGRMERRGRTKRLVDASEKEARRFLERSEHVVAAIAAEARRREIPVFTVDNPSDNALDNALKNEESRTLLMPTLEGWENCAKGLERLAGVT